MTLLALKLLLGPALVIGASLATRRFGPRIGGVVAGLPAVTGPILIVLALDHGLGFAADSATASLLAMIGLLTFVLAYAAVSRRASWQVSLAGAWAASCVVTTGLDYVHIGPYPTLLAVAAAVGVTLALLPRSPSGSAPVRVQPRWDLPLRGVCTLVPILVVTGLASLLGPHLSGLLAGFPIIAPILLAFTHAQVGAAEATRLLTGLTLGFVAFGAFCFVLAISLRGLGVAAAFALATVIAFAVQGALLVVGRRQGRQPASAEAAA